MGIYDKLTEYRKKDCYPMHMPGHKRNKAWIMENPYELDITEIEGFDNLHEPEDLLKECMEKAAHLYHSEETYYLVNGSTGGILTGISAVANQGDTILIGRNSHISVYQGAFLNQLNIVYLYPETDEETGICGSIQPEQVEEMLAIHPEISLVILTSPSYEGIVSDLSTIAEIVHRKEIPLMVDSAHGAHFGFSGYFPENAVASGADIVIHSLHKTLPSFTQTALLHISGSIIDRREIKRYFQIYHTTSPSYLLMAGIDRCMDFLSDSGKRAFQLYQEQMEAFYQAAGEFKKLKIWRPTISDRFYGFDPSKIIISTAGCNLSAQKLSRMLINEYCIYPEMVSAHYVLCMSSVCDTKEGLIRLKEALREIDAECGLKKEKKKNHTVLIQPEQKLQYYETLGQKDKLLPLVQSEGYISAEFIYLYPPGIPFLVPGEVISENLLLKLLEYKKAGFLLKGLSDSAGEYVRVMKGNCTKV